MYYKIGLAGVPGFSYYYFVLTIVFGSLTISGISSNGSQSYAATPITPSGLNTQVTLSATPPPGKVQYDITGGTRPGGGTNLFHSFGDFNVPNNNIANFLNETALPTTNILGRVTGGNISNVFGTIQTTGFGSANLFLMNPAGFLFGPNATVNVGGMVAFTSADYLRLADGVLFNAIPNPAADALLSAAPVAAFGFLGSNPGAITVQGSQLSVTKGQSISLVGGNITVQSGVLDDGITIQPARLSAPGGQINLASVASPGEVLYPSLQAGPNINGQSFTNMGNVTLSEGSILDVSADAAGTVRILGGQLVMDNATISADTVNSNGAPVAIDINVTGDISLTTVDNPVLTARTTGSGNAGAIQIASTNMDMTATSLNNFQFTVIDTHTSGSGKAGDVSITAANNLTMTGDPFANVVAIDSGTTGGSVDGAQGGNVTLTAKNMSLQSVFINTGSGVDNVNGLDGIGSGGNLTITADSLQMGPFTQVATDGPVQAGNITISARDVQITLSPGLSATSIGGNAGSIRITADQIKLDDSVEIGSINGAGSGGDISVNAKVVELTNGSSFATQTFGNSNAGNITITATDHVTLADDPSILGAPANPSGLFTNSFGNFGRFGNSGAITVTTPKLNISGGARIESSTRSSGHGGAVSITADTISIGGERPFEPLSGFFVALGSARASGIFTRTVGSRFCTGPCGDAGNVFITTGTLNLASGAQINSGTTSTGHGGNVVVNATGPITLSGTMIDGTPGGILSQAVGAVPGAGRGGDISLATGQSVSVTNGAIISASSTGSGNAGNVTIQGLASPAQSVLVDGAGSGIFTDTHRTGAGGDIHLSANSVTVQNSGTVSAETSGIAPSATGGTITVNANQLQINNGGLITASTTGAGAGGSINLGTGTFASNAGTVSTTAAQATGGDIAVTAGQSVTLSNGASISASSTGAGNAGNVMINAGQSFLATNSSVTTQASQASGGTITITTTPSGTVELINSTISASVLDGTGGGGSVNIDPQFVLLQNSQILAKAVQGPGGNISITTNLLFPDANSVISASSQFGVNGTVTVQSPNAPATGKIIPLSQKPLTATALLSQRCAALASGEFSSFTVAGRDSLPAEPGGWLASPLALAISESGGGTLIEADMQASPSEPVGETPLLSLRQIAPPGFLTQAFAVDWSAGCTS